MNQEDKAMLAFINDALARDETSSWGRSDEIGLYRGRRWRERLAKAVVDAVRELQERDDG